jgi:hypothetical protein
MEDGKDVNVESVVIDIMKQKVENNEQGVE